MGKVSVIIPVYNVASYLEACISSVVNQSYRNLEIIAVDDGSTDGSGNILDEWAKKDLRIKVIHKENGGLSSARNAALDIATGDYLVMIDGDDFVEKEYVSLMVNKALKEDADIVFCNYRFANEAGEEIHKSSHGSYRSEKMHNGVDVLELFENKSYRTFFDVCWNKLYRKELFEGIRFPDGISVIEDISIMPLIYHSAKRIFFVNDVLYFYVYRKGSLSHLKYDIKEDSNLRIPMMEKRLKWYKEWGNKELRLVHIIHMYSLYEKVKDEYKERMRELKREYRKEYLSGKYEKRISKSRKLKFFTAFISLKLYSALTKLVQGEIA